MARHAGARVVVQRVAVALGLLGSLGIDCTRRRTPDEPQSEYVCDRGDHTCSCEFTGKQKDQGTCGVFACCYGWWKWDGHNYAASGCYCTELDAATGKCPPPRNPADDRKRMCP